MNIKKLISDLITVKIENINYEDLIVESISSDKGDYCLPCFPFSKILKKNPNQIALDLASTVKKSNYIEKIEVVQGYLNFFLNIQVLSKEILAEIIDSKIQTEGQGKVVCIDYGSPNLAKYLHIGHLKTLIIGESLCRLFEMFGYTVKRLDFVGDYGTPFGKIIGGIELFGSMQEVEKRGNDALQDYYVKFNQL